MFVDRINAWLLKRLASRRAAINVRVTADGLQAHGRHGVEAIPWDEVVKVVATRSEQFVGDTLVLLLGLADGRVLTVTENTGDWIEIAKSLPIHLPGATPYETWALGAAFSGSGTQGIVVFQRN